MTRKNRYSNWREDLIEVMDIPSSEPKTDTEDEKKITEKKVKNKIVINPTMNEAFGEIGGIILEVVELDEVLDMKKADMGEVIKDFRKSDAPQFKGKSKEKRREMAIAAKLSAEERFVPPYKELKTVSNEKAKKKERESGVSEAVYGGTPVEKKDTRYSVTAADKKANTKAYQNYKAGDKRYKAVGPMGEATEVDKLEEDSRRMSNKQHTQRVRSNIKSFGSNYTPPSNYDPDANRGKGEVLTRKQIEKKRRKSLRQEEVGQIGKMPSQYVEAAEDRLRDMRQERGGVDGNVDYRRTPKTPNTKKFGTGKTMAQKEMEKKYGKGASVMDVVKAQIRSKYGKGAIMDTKKKK